MTQPSLGVRSDDYAEMDIDQLSATYLMFRQTMVAAKAQLEALQYEFHIRMKEAGDVQALPSGTYEIKMERRTAKYDLEKLTSNLEGVIAPEEIQTLVKPEWLKPMPEAVNGREALKIKTKYKGNVERIINEARIDTPFLRVEEKGELN